jgi:cell division protein FtsZ
MIHFDLPKEQSSIIKVIGVGGGGSNAVNHMFSQNIEGVNFIICNTDAQAIAQSKVPNKIQLGPHLTQGLGAGANPAIGRQATEESLEEITRILEVNTKMAFITAGMGGGTGTGGAPILAKICKDLGILTVGIVTTPFAYEGKKRLALAEEGIALLKDQVDTLLVISNDKLRHQFGNLKMKEAFEKADNVLSTAAKCITDVINSTGQINVDFADVCTVMRNGGVAILGSASAGGENRAQMAIENALNSPLLNDSDIRGARWILININSAEGDHEFTMDEVEVINSYLISQAGEDSDVIMGLGYDNTLGNEIGITLIATGFEYKDPFAKTINQPREEKKTDKIVMTLELPAKESMKMTQPSFEFDIEEVVKIAEIPAFVMPVNTAPAAPREEQKIVTALVMPSYEATKEPEAIIPDIKAEEINHSSVETISDDLPVYFEMAVAAEHTAFYSFETVEPTPVPVPLPAPVVAAMQTPKVEPVVATPMYQPVIKEASAPVSSAGGYLAKPMNIYVQEQQPQKPESNTTEELTPLQTMLKEDEPETEMRLVVKDSHPAAEEKPQVQINQTQSIMMSNVEEPALQDETEDLRRRATDRIAKLRNLSFNINAADPNNEFETVPAYLRRNMELHNSIADVESFYSNYTVKSTDNNQAEISSINTFLDGNKPD